MNVYQCWYRGLNGYCCRTHNSKWMFVPELGQTNNRIHKHIPFHELAFINTFARQYEFKVEQQLQKMRSNPFYFLKSLFFPTQRPCTVGGMLFTAV